MGIDEARAKCLELQSCNVEIAPDVRRTVPVPLFSNFVEGPWHAECFVRHKPSSRRVVHSFLKSQLLPAFGVMPLDRISRRDVNDWFDHYSATAPGGANRALDVLRQILNHAKVHGHVAINPASGIRRNPRRKFNRFLSREEIVRLHEELDRAVAERPSRAVQADIIRLLACTGCRLGEILSLKWREVGADMLNLTDGKTGPRKVYLNSLARTLLDRQPRTESPYVFPCLDDPMRPVTGYPSLWHRVRVRAGIEDVRLHDLRHNFASHAVMHGVPLPTVATLLGHRQISMTLRYAHIADREVEAAAERIGNAIAAFCKSPCDLAETSAAGRCESESQVLRNSVPLCPCFSDASGAKACVGRDDPNRYMLDRGFIGLTAMVRRILSAFARARSGDGGDSSGGQPSGER